MNKDMINNRMDNQISTHGLGIAFNSDDLL